MSTRVNLDDTEFYRGPVDQIILGRPDEQPARVHAPQPPKPPVTPRAKPLRVHRAEIQMRMQELRPLVKEHEELSAIIEAWKDI